MNRWVGKIAVVTGASSGIGAAIAQRLLAADVRVIGLARRVQRIAELAGTVEPQFRGNLRAMYCDIADPESIRSAFAGIEEEFGRVNILINNAGCNIATHILAADNLEALDHVIATNLRGTIHCTKAAFRLMSAGAAPEDGHIVNINSILGHSVCAGPKMPVVNVYAPCKYAMTAATEVLRQELNALRNRRVKVSSVSPGMVRTEVFEKSGYEGMEGIFERNAHLQPEDVADAVLYVLGTPHNVQVHELIIKPVGERV